MHDGLRQPESLSHALGVSRYSPVGGGPDSGPSEHRLDPFRGPVRRHRAQSGTVAQKFTPGLVRGESGRLRQIADVRPRCIATRRMAHDQAAT